jgi:hypothetical protein
MMLLVASALLPPSPTHTPPQHSRASPAIGCVGRRAILLGGLVAAAPVKRASALFENAAQLSCIKLATAQPKLRDIIAEVTETKRRRIKGTADPDDDAYVFRFARAVLDPVGGQMLEASPAVGAERAQELSDAFKAALGDLDAGCRAKSAADELDALTGMGKTLDEFLAIAEQKKFDVRPRDDINAYDGASSILYNKFLFRSG